MCALLYLRLTCVRSWTDLLLFVASDYRHEVVRMEPEGTRKDIIAALHDEMDALLFANRMYWEGRTLSNESDAEYQCRQDRLELIRRKLIQLDMPGSRYAPHTVREGK